MARRKDVFLVISLRIVGSRSIFHFKVHRFPRLMSSSTKCFSYSDGFAIGCRRLTNFNYFSKRSCLLRLLSNDPTAGSLLATFQTNLGRLSAAGSVGAKVDVHSGMVIRYFQSTWVLSTSKCISTKDIKM